MRYVSTRGCARSVAFTEALLSGAPADGGAYVPERVPKISLRRALHRPAFEDVFVEIFSLFVDESGDFDEKTLRDVAREVVRRYEGGRIASVRRLGRRGEREARALELFGGPTLSAEDASMQVTLRLMDKALARRQKRANVVCCSTGEAGGAMASVAAEMTRVDAWIAYPGDDGDVSDPQEREMTCHVEDHVHPIKVYACPDGVSDVDAVVNDVLADDEFRTRYGVVSANSANVARVLSYVPIFFHAYAQVYQKSSDWGKELMFTVPSATFAIEYAGHLAREMGLPITIVAACNANGVAHRMISLGEVYKTDMVHTSSSALDVVVAENVWRSLYLATGSNPLILSELQDDFDEDGEVALPPSATRELQKVFKSAVVDDELLFSVIEREERMGFLPCPQTALAIAAIELVEGVPLDVPVVAMAVSHPSKFPDIIRRAVPMLSNGASHPTVEAMSGLFHRRRTCTLEEFERSLRRDIAAVTSMRSPEPVRIERFLLSTEEYERLYCVVFKKKSKRWKALDNPLVTVIMSVVVAIWARAVSPPDDGARARKRAENAARREAERLQRIEIKIIAQAARDAERAARNVKRSAPAAAAPPAAPPSTDVDLRAYARARRDARPLNEHFAHVPSRNIGV